MKPLKKVSVIKAKGEDIILKFEGTTALKQRTVTTDSTPYIYYEICEGKRSHFETDYLKALNYFYTKVLFF
jgi:hypothetical protein